MSVKSYYYFTIYFTQEIILLTLKKKKRVFRNFGYYEILIFYHKLISTYGHKLKYYYNNQTLIIMYTILKITKI